VQAKLASRNRYWNLVYERVITWLLLLAMRVGGKLPLWLVRGIGKFIATIYFLAAPKYRRAIAGNLRQVRAAGGAGAERPLWRATLQVYFNYSRIYTDILHFLAAPPERLAALAARLEGAEHLEAALAAGRGAIFVTAHLGNWEVGIAFLGEREATINIVFFPDRFQGVRRALSRFRHKASIREVPVGEGPFAALPLLRALARNEVVAVQGDRDFNQRGILTPFCGAYARLPQGPVLLAMASGAPLIPVFITFHDRRSYAMTIEPPIPLQRTGNRDADVKENVRRVAEVISRWVKRYPEQWYCNSPYFEAPEMVAVGESGQGQQERDPQAAGTPGSAAAPGPGRGAEPSVTN